MNKKQPKITKTMQKVAAEILTEFMFTHDMDDVFETYDRIFKQYGLCDDPFTGTPCTPEEWSKNRLEYDRQVKMERYGHCDGLE
jgi:hypothetical protein